MKRTYKLTYAQRRDIVTRFEAGEKIDAIAEEYGVRREYPSKLAIRWGSVKRRPTPKRPERLLTS